MLHIIDSFPLGPSSLTQTDTGDTVLLVDNAVYAVQEGTYCFDMLKGLVPRLKLCVLGPDLEARGMASDRVISGVAVIGEREYEDLTEDAVAVRSCN